MPIIVDPFPARTPDLGVDVAITRDSLALADLQLQTAGTCDVVEHGPGGITWRQTWTTSPHAHGAYLTASVKEMVRMPLKLRVFGENQSILGERIDELVDGFSQFSYELVVGLDAISFHRWRCGPADISYNGGTFDSDLLRAGYIEIVLDIPRHPVPIEGKY